MADAHRLGGTPKPRHPLTRGQEPARGRAGARRSGATTLKLAVIPGNDPAVAVYARNGFVLTVERGDLLADGVTREQVMAKTLR